VNGGATKVLIRLLRSVDLGSGVGNCLGNIALYTGSTSIGCEYMPNPSRLARLQIDEIKVRWQMWAVKGNQECEAIEGDFCSDSTVIKALQKADLVVSLEELRPAISSINSRSHSLSTTTLLRPH
jgi:hypothetical protein